MSDAMGVEVAHCLSDVVEDVKQDPLCDMQ